MAESRNRDGASADRPSRAPEASPSSQRPVQPVISFDRRELSTILGLYGRKVAEGEWRDYAIDFSHSRAVFSIYRRTSEVPLYRIEKDPKLARRQGMYSVVAATGLIMRRGADLARVISVLDKKLKLVTR
ncbi:MAG: DUF2794 domain-containing protein [Beijerinckiaceae bacterium]